MWGVGAPVIIGPLNGGMEYPPAFRREQGLLSRVALLVGRVLANLFNLLIPGKTPCAFHTGGESSDARLRCRSASTAQSSRSLKMGGFRHLAKNIPRTDDRCFRSFRICRATG